MHRVHSLGAASIVFSLKEKRIAVIGLGLIGGSLALSLAAQGAKLYGFVKNDFNFPEAPFELVTQNLRHLQVCEVVFLCTPLNTLLQTLAELQPFLKPGAILSDVGSVKNGICAEAKHKMRPDCYFIGGHPMAGTEKSGFANAFPELFQGRPWALMKNSGATEESQEQLSKIIECTGARIIWTESEKHDKAVALISHLPLLLSLGLQQTVNNLNDPDLRELALKLASSGFEGMTRLARGNPELNRDLLKFNSEQVQASFELFLRESKGLLVPPSPLDRGS